MTPRHARRPGFRPAWWHELLLIAVVYGGYTLTRNTLPAHVARARGNALDVYRAERWLHVDVERALNDAVASRGAHALAVAANYMYSVSHLAVTVAVLGWLYVARSGAYRAARTTLLLTTVLGLLGFWLFPLAPPRFFPHLGFVDTIVRDGTWGSWGSNAVTKISNQYAAMPSVHVAWSAWAAAAIVLYARSRWLKAAAVLYPPVVVFVIIGTANHWVLDAVGGLVAVGLGWAITHETGRWRPSLRARAGTAAAGAIGRPDRDRPPRRSAR